MPEMSASDRRLLAWVIVVVVPLFMAALDFVLIFATYLVLARTAPDLLGSVAASPAVFAAWVALVKLPTTFAYLAAVAGRAFKVLLDTGDVPDPPVRQGSRRILFNVRGEGMEVLRTMVAALIVFGALTDPADTQLWQLVVLTAAGQYLLPKPVTGLLRLLRWWWRRRPGYRARHRRPDEQSSPDQSGVSPEPVPGRDQA